MSGASKRRGGSGWVRRVVETCCGALLCVLLGALGSVSTEADGNLVSNPGFESVDGELPLHWRFDGAETEGGGVSGDARSGAHCVYTQLDARRHASWWQDGIPVEPNTTYEVGLWVWVDLPASLKVVRLTVVFDTHTSPYHTEVLTPGRWHRLSYTVRSWPEDRHARIRILLGRDWEGRARFDDVFLQVSDVDWMDRFPKTSLAELAFQSGHPCVLLDAAEIEDLRRAIETEPWAREAYEGLLGSAEGLLAEGSFRLPDLDFTQVGPGYNYMKDEAARSKVLGLAYQLSKRAEFGEAARERLLAYAGAFPEGNLCRGGYGYTTAYALFDVVVAYDLVHDSPALSDADREVIERMVRLGFQGMARKGDVMRINNRGAVCLGAMAAIAFCLKDRDLIDWALNGPYGFNYHLQAGIGDDGIWSEGVSYGYMALGAPLRWNCGYLSVAEAAHHAGIDLFSHARLRRLLDAPLEYAFPDHSLPADGHCPYSEATLLGRDKARRYIKPWLRTGDPRYVWVISEGFQIDNWPAPGGLAADLYLLAGIDWANFPSGKPPERTSALYPQVGHAMLRSGRGRDAVCLFFDYGAFGSHGNPDKLNMGLYALDHVLSPDGTTGYWWPETFMYECQTLGHNTVVVDEKTQFPTADRELVAWIPGGRLQVVDARDDQANPGVRMRRTLALGEGYVVDLFSAESDQEHRYDWVYRNFGKLEVSTLLQARLGTLGIRDGYQYITSPSRSTVAESWHAEWDLREMNRVWNASFELHTGPAWQAIGWRIPEPRWRPWVVVDPEVQRTGAQSLRIAMPEGPADSVHVIATYNPAAFVAGVRYLVEGFVWTQDVLPPESEVGIWVGDRLVCSAPTQVEPTAKGWMKISGIYVATVDHREMVRIGVRNAPGAMVWFDDVSVRIRDEGPRALRLTMLGAPGTEVISSEGEGLRPFPQPLLIARRKGKATVFASVMEPYRGRRIVRSVRPLAPDPHDGGAGVVVETDDTIDRVAVSTTSGVESFPDLILEGAVGAVSVSLKTGALRCLCLGEGTRIAHGSWSLEAAQPTTLYLEGTDGSYLLRSWGEDSVQITLRAPDIDRDWAVVEGEGEGGVGERVDADLSDGRASFVARGGTSYRLGRTANRGDR